MRRGGETCHGEESLRSGEGSACGPARVAISSSTAEVRSSKLPVASGVRYPMAWRKLEYSAASKGAGFRACHASISPCGSHRGEIEVS